MPIGDIRGLPLSMISTPVFEQEGEEIRSRLAMIVAERLQKETPEIGFTFTGDPTRRSTTPTLVIELVWDDPTEEMVLEWLEKDLANFAAAQFARFLAPRKGEPAGVDVVLHYDNWRRRSYFLKVHDALP